MRAYRRRPFDEMYACASNAAERAAINDLLFGSVTDVLDRYLPDKEKHGALRGMLAFLAVNTTYRGPEVPGTAAALAYGLAVPDENAALMKKLKGGIGALTGHLRGLLESAGGEVRLRSKVEEITVATAGGPDGRVTGVRLEDGSTLSAPIVVSSLAPDLTVNGLLDPAGCPPRSAIASPASTTAAATCRCTSPSTAFPSSRRPTRCSMIPPCSRRSACSTPPRNSSSSGRPAGVAWCPPIRPIALQIPSVHDPALAPAGKHAASAFSLWFPDRSPRGRLRRS